MHCRLHNDGHQTRRWSDAERQAGRVIDAYLAQCADRIGRAFDAWPRQPLRATETLADTIVRILLRHEFNYQSNGRVAHLLPDIRRRIEQAIRDGRPVPIYFLFHGGYRASAEPHRLNHVFAPDATEFMLLFQAARLQEQVTAVYPPGVSFAIVINNGVAAWTNGIAYAATEGYAARLRHLIARLGAGGAVWVLLQSELGDFADDMAGIPIAPVSTIGADDHHIVERFLGRGCSVDEAREYIARYAAAEAAWARRLAPMIDAASGIFVRQVAHPACLSFRPFPGGATRVQNGAIGFSLTEGRSPVPFLITTRTAASRPLRDVPVDLPWLAPAVPQAA